MIDIKDNMQIKNNYLSIYACNDSKAIYLNKEEGDFRTPFYRDIDRIIYSLAFTRYINKTQVFTFQENDHLQTRMIHVQYVSKIARTIGRALGLNEDLIEAAALGHDLGHTPFGHVGEAILNKISLREGVGYFNHNIHSVRLLKDIESYGKGKNITIQTLDAIMCHNGEFALGKYEPKEKTEEEFLKEYEDSYKDPNVIKTLKPMTLEGCVVRVSDLIGYLGRDIEDALRLNIIKLEDIPKNIIEVLGSTNREIVNTIITDIIKNSVDKNYILLSDNIFEAIVELKNFNYKYIYSKANTKEELNYLEQVINTLYKVYLNDLETNNKESNIINSYLKNMSKSYKTNNSNKRIVIDYIAGMTDEYCLKEYNKYLNNFHTKKEVENDL